MRGEGLPAPDRETLTASGSRLRGRCGVEPVMAQLCGLRLCGAFLALLASLLLFRAEAADGERGVHGEGQGGSPGRSGRPTGGGRGARGLGQGLSRANRRERELGDLVKLGGVWWSGL